MTLHSKSVYDACSSIIKICIIIIFYNNDTHKNSASFFGLKPKNKADAELPWWKWQFCSLADCTTHKNKIWPILFHRTQVWFLCEIIVEKCGYWTSSHCPTWQPKSPTANKIIIYPKSEKGRENIISTSKWSASAHQNSSFWYTYTNIKHTKMTVITYTTINGHWKL